MTLAHFRNAVLADTSALYALVDPRDQNNVTAQVQSQRLVQEKRRVLVTYTTLQEAHALVLHRLDLRTAQRWLAEVTQGTTLLSVPAEDFQAALEQVYEYSDQATTLHDFVLSVVSKKLGVSVWTFDEHFDILRADVWRPT